MNSFLTKKQLPKELFFLFSLGLSDYISIAFLGQTVAQTPQATQAS